MMDGMQFLSYVCCSGRIFSWSQKNPQYIASFLMAASICEQVSACTGAAQPTAIQPNSTAAAAGLEGNRSSRPGARSV
jgi:hypothetical protein